MQSLNIGKHIETMVVDTWAIVLNDAEKFKSDDSPLRLFFTIGCVVIKFMCFLYIFAFKCIFQFPILYVSKFLL